MGKNIKNDIILERICAASIDNFAYTLYRIDKYANPYRYEYLIVSFNDNKKFYGFSKEDVKKEFLCHIEGVKSFLSIELSPLSETEFNRLIAKVESGKRELLKILAKERYLSEKNSILQYKEIFNHHDDIIKILENNTFNIKIMFQQIDRYIGGYYYILLNKKYENNYEIKQITEKLNN